MPTYQARCVKNGRTFFETITIPSGDPVAAIRAKLGPDTKVIHWHTVVSERQNPPSQPGKEKRNA